MRSNLILLTFLSFSFFLLISSCQSEEEITYARYYVNGKGLYEQYCQNCHSNTGAGLGELIPPLTDTVSIKKNKEAIPCFIKYGLAKQLQVNNQTYEGKMPANTQLSNIEIAELVTYVTNSFGNKYGLTSVDQVAEQLKDCR